MDTTGKFFELMNIYKLVSWGALEMLEYHSHFSHAMTKLLVCVHVVKPSVVCHQNLNIFYKQWPSQGRVSGAVAQSTLKNKFRKLTRNRFLFPSLKILLFSLPLPFSFPTYFLDLFLVFLFLFSPSSPPYQPWKNGTMRKWKNS
jgi:hypothetical protein